MTALTRPRNTLDGALPLDGDQPLVAEVYDDLASVEPLWRALETEGFASPYQRYDWVAAYAGTLAAAEGLRIRTVVLSDAVGRPLLLFPLGLERRGLLRIAAPVGGKQANYHVPLRAAAGLTLSDAAIRAALVRLGRERLGVDAFAFGNVPRTFAGHPNPLAAGGRPNPSDAYCLPLDPADPEATLARAFGKTTRKKLGQKGRNLASAIGPTRLLRARDAETLDRVLAAFAAQKRARFRARGIPNPFDGAAALDFLRRAATGGQAGDEPALVFYALASEMRVAAVFGAAVDARRCSGMVISFDAAPEIARCSPGDLMLQEVLRAECAAGRSLFDLGVGEAGYKTAICDTAEPLVETFWPVTRRGQSYALAARGAVRLKRAVKQTPWLFALARRARAAWAAGTPTER